jgi:Arc/MetJ-type ribon-helix-helix transcriptional regulator
MTEKIAISLPDELLRMIEAERKRRGLSRSEFLRAAVQEHFQRVAERSKEARYVAAYQADPELETEWGELAGEGVRAWAGLPWEEDDQAR